MSGEAWRYLRVYDVSLARMINYVHGAPVIAAWEVAGLDEMWIETFAEVALKQQDNENLKRHTSAIASQTAAWKREQNYRH